MSGSCNDASAFDGWFQSINAFEEQKRSVWGGLQAKMATDRK